MVDLIKLTQCKHDVKYAYSISLCKVTIYHAVLISDATQYAHYVFNTIEQSQTSKITFEVRVFFCTYNTCVYTGRSERGAPQKNTYKKVSS